MPGYPPLTLTDELPFGDEEHKGVLIGTLIELDDGRYIEWCIDNLTRVKFAKEVHDYVRECAADR